MWPIGHISVACHGIHVHQPLASIPSIPIMAAVLCCPRYSNVLTRPDPQRADWKCAAISSSVSCGVSPTIFTQNKSSGEEDIVHWLGAHLELAPCELKRIRAVTVRGKKECNYNSRNQIDYSYQFSQCKSWENMFNVTFRLSVKWKAQEVNERVSIHSSVLGQGEPGTRAYKFCGNAIYRSLKVTRVLGSLRFREI